MPTAATPTHTQANVIRHLAGVPEVAPRSKPTQATYRKCLAEGWIEDSCSHPFHRVLPAGLAAIGEAPYDGQPRKAAKAAEKPVEPSRPALLPTTRTAAPQPQGGEYGSMTKALEAIPTDAARYAFLAWLASPAGTEHVSRLKDAVVVAARVGRTYAQTAEHLGITTATVNRAVSRHNARTKG